MALDNNGTQLVMAAQTTLLHAVDLQRAMAGYQSSSLRGDHLLNEETAPPAPWRQAAVLVPVLADDTGLRILFTLRTAHLHAHAGQICFPGGGAEAQDADAIATALRESEEEIGLDPARVQVLGSLDSYITRSGYQVTPVVGLIDASSGGHPAWRPDEFEVADIFDVPLSHILTPGVLRQEAISREGIIRRTYVCSWRDYHIWGATAGMLRNLVEAIVR